MADVNLASLNFKLIIDDGDFDNQIARIKSEAELLNKKLTEMLNVHGGGFITKEEHQSAMRMLQEQFREAQNQQKLKLQWSKETAKMASDEAIAAGKIAQQQEKANNEKKKGLVIDEQIAAATQRKLEAETNAAAATERKTKAEKDAARAEIQRQTAAINQAAAEERKATATNNRIRSQQRLNAEMEREGTILRRNSRIWNDMKNVALAYFSFEGARRIVSSLVQVSAEFEKQRVSLRAILRDMDGAEKIFGQIKSLAVQSPFQFKELVTYTKQLSAFSIPMNELYDTTKMLADVSAGLGVGMDRLVLAYGQIRSASFLRGQEVRQLTEAGIPILTELAKQFEELEGHYVSAGEVFDRISKRQVTFEMVEKVFKDMTSEGGKFYQMQEVLADTLSGKISNLTDAYQIMFAEIGEKNKGILYKSVDALRALAENYEKVGRAIAELVAVYGTYRTMMAAGNFATAWGKASAMAIIADGGLARGASSAARGLAELTRSTKLYQAANAAVASINPFALLAAAAVALGVHIYNLTTRTTAYEDALKEVNKASDDFISRGDGEIATLRYMFSRLESLNSESEEYKNIRRQIIDQYGNYLSDIDKENLAIGELAGIYDKLASSIKKVSMEKAASAARDKVSEYVTEATADVRKKFNEALEKAGFDKSGSIAMELRDYIFGDRSELSKEAEDAAKKIGNQSWWRTAGRNIAKSLLGEFSIFVEQSESDTIDSFKATFQQIGQDADKMLDDIPEGLKWLDGAFSGTGKTTEELDGWRLAIKNIADEAVRMKAATGIEIDSSSELIDVYDQVSKAADKAAENMERYRLAGEEGLYESEKNRLQYLNSMKARLGGDMPSGGNGKGSVADKDTTDAVVRNIQSQIRVYKRLQETYEGLITTMSDKDARVFMSSLFPQYGTMVGADFDEKITTLGDDLLELALYSDSAAEAWLSYMDAMSDDKLDKYNKEVEEAKKNTENYKALLESWDGMLPSPTGLNKIVSDYEKKLSEIEKLRDDSFKALWAQRGSMSQEEYLREFNLIHEKYLDAREAQLNDARSKAESEIADIYKTWRDENLDFENLSDKTISQLGELKDAIRNFNFSSLTEEQQMLLLGLLGDLDRVNEVMEKVKSGDIGKLKSEEKTKDIRAWRQLAESILSAAKSLKEFAEASDNVALGEVADAITKAGELTKNVLNGFKNADIAGAVVAGVSTVAEWLLDAATHAAQLKAELAEIAMRGYLNEIDERIKSLDGLFGSSLMGHIRGVSSEIRTLGTAIRKALDTSYLSSTSKYTGDIFKSLDSELQKYALNLNMTLKDTNGFFNKDTLDAIEAKYGKEMKKNGLMSAFTDLRDMNEKMKSLYEDLTKSIAGMFDSLGSDIADSLIESLKATGSAVTDLEGVFQNLGDSIFKSMVQSYIIDEVLNKYKDEVMSWWTDSALTEADIANRMRDFADSVKNDIDLADDRLTAMYNAFMENSLLTVGNGSEEGKLSNGVKGITEDTASLLASYINAIRADVAAIRQTVVTENAMAVPAPTLAEYLTQIQANTYNNAVAAQAILENLQSMMTTSDGPALRVFM